MANPIHDDGFVDHVKSSVVLSDYIGKTVKLTRAGHEFRGLSPFSKEKTPSFYVNDAKGWFFDFSSGKNGDVFTFAMALEHLSFPQALERVASFAGIEMPAASPEEAIRRGQCERLLAACASAATWFKAQLLSSAPAAIEALTYLRGRGLAGDGIQHWNLGFAPKEGGLADHLRHAGFSEKDGIDAGLLIRRDRGRVAERFRDRIMFPIEDIRYRKTVSFGGRALTDTASAKYLNGPETAIFQKSEVLYGLASAMALLTRPDHPLQNLVVVEGYFDVISSQAAGVPAVGPLGTALSEVHLKQLWQRCDEPTILFDGDRAGIGARGRAIDKALPALRAGKSLAFAFSEGGKDPDEVLRKYGPERLIEDATTIQPLWEAVFERARGPDELDTPERLVAFRHRLQAAAESIRDREIAEAYLAMLMRRYVEDFGPLPESPRPMPSPADLRPVEAAQAIHLEGGGKSYKSISSIAASLVHAGLNHPSWLAGEIEQIRTSGFGDPALRTVALTILRALEAHADGNGPGDWIRQILVENGFSEELKQIADAQKGSGAPYLLPRIEEPLARLAWHHTLIAHNRLYALRHMFEQDDGSLIDALGQATFLEYRGELDRLRSAFRSGYFWEQLVAGLHQMSEEG